MIDFGKKDMLMLGCTYKYATKSFLKGYVDMDSGMHPEYSFELTCASSNRRYIPNKRSLTNISSFFYFIIATRSRPAKSFTGSDIFLPSLCSAKKSIALN